METFTKLHFSKQLYSWDCFGKLKVLDLFLESQRNGIEASKEIRQFTIWIVIASLKKSPIQQTFDWSSGQPKSDDFL